MKAPKLKMSKPTPKPGAGGGLKPPKFAADLFADLRDRRLLPLVALLLVAIAAVPFLLKSTAKPAPTPPAPAAVAPSAASFSVVPATPELRDYRKRFKHRHRVSPFSSYAAVGLSNESREAVEGIVDAAESGELAEPAPGGEEVGGTTVEPAPQGQPPVKATIKANLGVEAVVKVGFSDLEPREEKIPAQTRLPKPENTVVIYNGPSKDGHGALFLMSNQVSAYYGSGKCVVGGETCQVLELGPGKSATFAVGFGETRYKVTFVDFVPVVREATTTIQPKRP